MNQHILKTHGVTVTAVLDEQSGQMKCQWSKLPGEISKNKQAAIITDYSNWRNAIMQDWVDRSGKKTMVLTMLPGGGIETTCLTPKQEEKNPKCKTSAK